MEPFFRREAAQQLEHFIRSLLLFTYCKAPSSLFQFEWISIGRSLMGSIGITICLLSCKKKKSNWSLNASLRPRLGVAAESHQERIFDGGNSLRMYCFFPSCLLWRRSRTIQPCSVFKGCSLHIQVAPDLILVK